MCVTVQYIKGRNSDLRKTVGNRGKEEMLPYVNKWVPFVFCRSAKWILKKGTTRLYKTWRLGTVI